MKIFPALILLSLPFFSSGKESKLRVSVDERVELLTTIQLLSGYQWLTEAELGYKKEVSAAFDSYKDHPAVQLYRSISVSRRFYGYAPLLFLCHYRLPDFKQVGVFNAEDEEVLNYKANKDTLDRFLDLAKHFHKVSGFHAFFLSHQAWYDSVSHDIMMEAQKRDYAGVMEKYFGQKKLAYEVVLSPLQMDAGFGPMIQTRQGEILYAIVGPDGNSGSFPVFNKEVIFRELVIHEFSHSFCNPLIDRFYAQLRMDSCLLKPILKEQKEQGYGEWKTCLYEHLTRANEIMLSEIIYGREAADSMYKLQVEEDRWIYLQGLVPLLRNEYINNRDKYKTQEPLMGKVVEYFDRERNKCP